MASEIAGMAISSFHVCIKSLLKNVHIKKLVRVSSSKWVARKSLTISRKDFNITRDDTVYFTAIKLLCLTGSQVAKNHK